MLLQLASIFSVGLTAALAVAETTDSGKRSFSIPVRRAKSLVRRDGASSAATEHVVIDFTFGGQQIPVAIDSGSSFTWVASTLVDSETKADNILPTLYNPNISSTYHDEDDPTDAYDCSGNLAECYLGLDDIATAGLTANQMTFGVATQINEGVFVSGQAATMGFGRQAGDPAGWLPRDQTFWYRVGADLPSPYLFTVDIYGDRDGSFDFGNIDQDKYRGDITYADVDTSINQWNFNLTGFAIGGGDMQVADEFTGILDTGGPNIGLPAQVVNAYFSSFGGTPSPGNSHDYPCSAYPPPDLTLQLASGGTILLNGTFLVEPPDGSGSETCAGRLDNSVQTQYNFGQSVFDQKFVVFDIVGKRVGFADKASFAGSQSQSTSSGRVTSTTSTTTTATVQSTTSSSELISTSATTATASPTTNAAVKITNGQGEWVGSFMALYFLL